MPYKDPEKRRIGRLKRRQRNYEWVKEFKINSGGCPCGVTDPDMLVLHHLNPDEKEMTMSDLTAGEYSIKRIREEAEKCVVMCANCHNKLHSNGYNNGGNIRDRT